jgi:hypothetical protein
VSPRITSAISATVRHSRGLSADLIRPHRITGTLLRGYLNCNRPAIRALTAAVTWVSVPSRLIFRCEYCGVRAEGATERALEAQLQEFLFGEYLDVEPGHWLHGPAAGSTGGQYACGEHAVEGGPERRGTLGWHPWDGSPPGQLPPRPVAARRTDPGRSSRWARSPDQRGPQRQPRPPARAIPPSFGGSTRGTRTQPARSSSSPSAQR